MGSGWDFEDYIGAYYLTLILLQAASLVQSSGLVTARTKGRKM